MGRKKGGKNRKPVPPEGTVPVKADVIVSAQDDAPAITDAVERLQDEHARETGDAPIAEERPRRKRRSSEEARLEEQALMEARYREEAGSFGEASAMILDILITRLPNPKPLTDAEKVLCSNAISRIAIKYLPQAAGYGPELMAGIALLAVVVPRLKKPVDVTA